MKNVKYQFNTLCLYDYRGVEAHLSAMAAQGWRLEKAGNTFWKYYRAEPANIRYAVTYSAGASQFNPRPTEGQRALADLCEEAGWRKVCDWFQMQIFRAEDPGALPLETDEALRLENIHRSMRKNFLPGSVVLLVLGLLMSAMFLYTLCTDPLQIFERNSSLLTGPMYILVSILEIYTLCHYYGWRRRSRRSIEDGGPCAPLNTRAYQRLSRTGLILLAVCVAFYLLVEISSRGRGRALFFLIYLSLFFLVVFLIRQSTAFFRHCGASKAGNIAGTLIVDVVLTGVLIGGLTWGVLHLGWFSDTGAGETYVYRDMEWDVTPAEDFPLTISELTGEDYEHISRVRFDRGSLFVPERSYRERAVHENGPGRPLPLDLSYTVWDPKFAWLREALLARFQEDLKPPYISTRQYVPEDPLPWGLETVYRRYIDGEPTDNWLLCWPGRVAAVSLDWTPTDREKALIAARLAPGV